MDYTKTIALDISGHSELKKVYAKQNDRGSRFLSVRMLKDGAPIDLPENVIARLRAIKPDGTCVLNDCTVNGYAITVELTEQVLAAVGIVRADIGLYDGETLLSTAPFLIQVLESTLDEEAVESSYELNSLTSALLYIDETIDNVNQASERAEQAVEALEALEIDQFVKNELKTGSETEYKVLSDNNLTDELLAQIRKVTPASNKALGIVRGTADVNGITVNADGTMTVNSININKLIQNPDDELCIVCGNSSINKEATS